jgi:hypothetical protein
MHGSRGWGRAAALAIAAVTSAALAGCAPIRVDSFVERGTDFGRIRSYGWANADTLSTGDARLDNNPFFQRRVQADVEAQLSTRGMHKASDGTRPDVVLHYHASATDQISVSGLDQDSPRCESGVADCAPIVYEKGSLVLDFVDPATNKLLWRGWATTPLDNVIDNQRALEATIDDAVRRIMARLPPLGS